MEVFMTCHTKCRPAAQPDARRRRANSLLYLCVAAIILLQARAAGAGSQITVQTAHRSGVVRIDAHAWLDAPLELVWETLTDYEHLWQFVPGLLHSRVLRKEDAVTLVEEHGEASLLFMTFPLDVVLASHEHPPYRIDVHAVKGNLKRLDGSYRVIPSHDGRLLLKWSGEVEPDFWLPPFVAEGLVRSRIAAQFEGMVREIERRHALMNE